MAIMRKDEPSDGSPLPPGQTHTVLGPEATFDGKLTFQGTVRIDGGFSGEIVTDDVLVVGKGAKIKAEVHVGSLYLDGEIDGNVVSKNSVEIHAPGVLRGNIHTPSITIERGAIFEGSCHMQNLGQASKPMPKPEPAKEGPPPLDPDKIKK
ncbi:MAG: polymer-forming cytoskeletal protein [Deltaproteobacteria bacterium]|nr:polymer-forming cytoskeletal protein [Deltaproteobacteria bacterium]